MTIRDNIDSNNTELRFAEEVTPGVLSGSDVWYALDPNDYQGFGGQTKLLARNPINASRQRKKGVVVDVDANAALGIDFTQDNHQRILQGFMFAALRKKDELDVATVDTTADTFQPASGGAAYTAGDLLFAKSFDDTANNGVHKVSGFPTATSIIVGTNLTTASGQSGVISRVGFEFASAVAAIDASGTLPKLVVTNAAAAQTLTGDGTNITDADTVTITGPTSTIVYTFQNTLTAGSSGQVHVLKAGSAAGSLTNLFHAINSSGGTPGTDYSTTGTGANPDVVATNPTGTTVVVTAIVLGVTGNEIAVAEASTHLSWGGTKLTGGTGRDLTTLGLMNYEWVCIGDDGTNQSFASTENNGLKRIKTIAATYLEFDKSSSTMTTDAGTGKTVRLLFGRVLKNETADSGLIVYKYYQFERTLGAPDAALPTSFQAEYVTASLSNKLELEIKQADKLMTKLSFMSRDSETQDHLTGRKAGTRPTLRDSDGLNATSHVARMSLAVQESGNEAPDDLFAFVMDLKVTIDNHVKANKAIKHLGAFSNTAGTFDVSVDMTAYFQTVDAIESVRNNEDFTFDITFAHGNQGVTLDVPLLAGGDARLDVKQDEAIKLPLKCDAATNAKNDSTYGDYTLLWVFWDYLPTLAH